MAKKLRRFAAYYKAQPGFWIEFSAVEFPAAFQAGDGALNRPDSRKFLAAPRTTIQKPAGARLNRKRQGVAARFIGDTEIPAGFSPRRAVGRNPALAGAELREQMRQLMPQGAIDFRRVVLAQARV